jgi:photosystem II stability/assembly factor-like uncharacterized protein
VLRLFFAYVLLLSSYAFAGINSWTETPGHVQNPSLIAINPADLNSILVASSDRVVVNGVPTIVYTIQRSTDAGGSWSPVLTSTAAIAGLVFTPGNHAFTAVQGANGKAGVPEGVGVFYKSFDGGATWEALSPGLLAQPETLAYDSRNGALYAGTDSALFRSMDEGASWTPILGGKVPVIALDPASSVTLYVAKIDGVNDGLYKTSDGGASWTKLLSSPDPRDGGSASPIKAIVVDPLSPSRVLVGVDGGQAIVYRSVDGGATFSVANAGLIAQDLNRPSFTRSMIAVPGSAATTFFHGNESGPFRSLDGGRAWERMQSGLPLPARIRAFALDPGVPGRIYAAFAPESYSGQVEGGLFTLDLDLSALPPEGRIANLSTRARVQGNSDDFVIGGFIVGGNTPKTLMLRATGPSLAPFGVTDPLLDPKIEVMRGNTLVASNDDWGTSANAADMTASGFAPNHPKESAVMMPFDPAAPYTAIVSGVGGTAGVANVEIFEVDHPETPLINISTRANVLTGENATIAGFVIQGATAKTVVINVAGPSLSGFFPASTLLANPTLTLVRSSDQAVIASNDDWGQAANAQDIQASGLAPNNVLEPAIMMSLPPGAYTAIVGGVGGGTGRAVVGVFAAP